MKRMAEKPTTAEGYTDAQFERVLGTCLYVATKLNDLMDDLVIIGGLVPALIVDQESLQEGQEAHVGTTDLDVGLTIGLLDQQRYSNLTDRLRSAKFSQDTNPAGNPTRQRWKIEEGGAKVTLDFLIQPMREGDRGGEIFGIEEDFAATIAPGLHLGFQDRVKRSLTGETILGAKATRDVWVCGPGAYVVLKALAFGNRTENKDAYDLFYVIRNYGEGVRDVAAALRPLLEDEAARAAVEVLRRDFLDPDGLGPRAVAEFLQGEPDDAIQADVVGFVTELLD